MGEADQKVRIDKWLWHARHFKTRTRASRAIADGHVRVNSKRIVKPSFAVGTGDVLTFRQGRDVRVVRIVALADRRGPSAEAVSLYVDLAPPTETAACAAIPLPGRPRRRECRIATALKSAIPD